MRPFDMYGWIAFILLIVGGINSGIMGLFGADIIVGILGGLLGRLVLIVIGAAAGYICYLIYVERFKKTL